MAELRGVLLGMGNPLLDVSAVVDQAFLDKYDVRYSVHKRAAPAPSRARRPCSTSPRADPS
jgi:hypothetical protein